MKIVFKPKLRNLRLLTENSSIKENKKMTITAVSVNSELKLKCTVLRTHSENAKLSFKTGIRYKGNSKAARQE